MTNTLNELTQELEQLNKAFQQRTENRNQNSFEQGLALDRLDLEIKARTFFGAGEESTSSSRSKTYEYSNSHTDNDDQFASVFDAVRNTINSETGGRAASSLDDFYSQDTSSSLVKNTSPYERNIQAATECLEIIADSDKRESQGLEAASNIEQLFKQYQEQNRYISELSKYDF